MAKKAKTMTFEAKIKPWGNSLGITLPKEQAKAFGLKTGDTVLVDLKRQPSWRDVIGTLPDFEERAGMSVAEAIKKTREELKSKWD